MEQILITFILMIAGVVILYLLAKHFAFWRRFYIVYTIVIMLIYIIWRLFFTLNFASVFSGLFSILLYIAEALGVFVALFSMSLFFRDEKIRRETPTLKDGYQPSVAIFICTYNEPYKLVVSSALAAASLPYENKKVYICDDGKRDLLKLSAETLGIEYITRSDNEHAKAGNINHALSVTQSDLVLLLDADFIVKPNLIKTALPYFQDEHIAMVQFPQAFYNKDSFQILNEKFFNEQDFFMRYIEPELSERNAMIHIGTNALIRRSALEEIGGIPTSSITEDMATGILLQNAGYRTIFINKAYALGIAPYNLKDLRSQRQRWAKGTVQIFRAIHPLLLPGLSLRQKAIYFELYLYWFTSFQKLIYLLIPTVFMVFAIPVVNITLPQFLLGVVPTLLLFGMSFRILIGNVRTYTSSHIYDTLMAPYHSSAILQEFFHPSHKFNVTPKDLPTNYKTNLRPVIPHIILAIWLMFSLGVAAYKIGLNVSALPLIVCCGWTVYNLYALAYSIIAAKSSAAETAGEALSVDIEETLEMNNKPFFAYQMSFDGFRVCKPKNFINDFIPGTIYEFTVPRTGLVSTAEFIKESPVFLEFQFMNTEKEAAFRLSRFYVEKLHAAHMLETDCEEDKADV